MFTLKSIIINYLVVVAFILAWKLWNILAGIFLAIIIAWIIGGAIESLKKIKFPRALSVLLIYLAILAIFYFTFCFLIPPFVDEVKDLATISPKYLEKFSPGVEGAKAFLIEHQTSESLQKALLFLGDKLAKISSSVPAFLSSVFGGLINVFLIVFISILFSLEEKGVEKFIGIFVPLNRHENLAKILAVSQKKIREWFKGRLFSAIIVGILVYLGLLLIGAQYKLSLALTAFLFEFVPVIGPWFAAIIGIILVGLQSLKLGLFALILYVVVQQLESHLITPFIMKKFTGINPILTILVLLIGAKLGGILGIFIAMPLTIIFVEVINEFRKKEG